MSFFFHPHVREGIFSVGPDQRPVKDHVYEAKNEAELNYAARAGHTEVEPGSSLHKELLRQTYEQGTDTSDVARQAAVERAQETGTPPPLDFSAADIEEFRAFKAWKQQQASAAEAAKETPAKVETQTRAEKNESAADEKDTVSGKAK